MKCGIRLPAAKLWQAGIEDCGVKKTRTRRYGENFIELTF